MIPTNVLYDHILIFNKGLLHSVLKPW